jgi:hypothetical protein
MTAAGQRSRQSGEGRARGWALAALLSLVGAGITWSCGNPPLERPPPPIDITNNELEIEGTVCPTPPSDAVFPVKILFLVDVSGSLVVTDPADVRGAAVTQVIQKYQGLPGIEFDVITFSSAIVNVTNGFTSTPNIGAISAALGQADNLTDDQGALAATYEALTEDMLKSTPAERARSRYIVIMFTDGVPDPLCSADTTPCGPTMSCMPHTHCVPTTDLTSSGSQQEQYACNPDYLVCTVPKKDWASAFNPPVDPSLYPGLLAGANYNTTPQLLSAVTEMMALQKQYHVGSIELDTNLLFPLAALSNPLAVPFDLDRPAAEALLMAMASAGNGTFQEFTSNTDINFLNINFSSIQVKNDVVVTYASNQNAIETGDSVAVDTDADGLTDDQERSLGTCAALSKTCKTPSDSDGDGYGDFIEVQYETSGFDPLDPTKPTVKCVSPGVDTDGDGLMDCEETFLKTDPQSPDTDGDLTLDNTELRTGLNPLDPTDAVGDINKDGILNQNEVQIGLSPTAQISTEERPFAFTYAISSMSAADAASSCYDFGIQHLRLMDTGPTAAGPEGVNRIYYDIVQTGEDSPTNLALVRRACATVLFANHVAKVPLSGVVNFVDSDFVDLASFDPKKNCKDLTEGVVIGGDGGLPVVGGDGGRPRDAQGP